MKSTAIFLFTGCMWFYMANTSHAQFGGPFGGQGMRPAVSPYLNINRPGNTPGFNYYGLVRPQLAANKAFQNLGTELGALEATSNQPSQTGHASSFMTQNRYFMNNGTSMVGQRRGQQMMQQMMQPLTQNMTGQSGARR